jgi:hypothetical protein
VIVMATSSDDSDGCTGGCLLLFGVLIVVGLTVMALISLAALLDPFDWLPPVGDIWADCQDNPATPLGECDLATRFPGFWAHAILNLLWAVITGGLLLAVTLAVPQLRAARAERFVGPGRAEAYRAGRRMFAALVAAAGVCALIPIGVAGL